MTNIGIYIYNDAEVLDFSGPYEVFSTAARISTPACCRVFLIGQSETVTARGGYSVKPEYRPDNHPPLDVLLIPGGIHTSEMHNAQTLNWLTEQSASVQITASVCTGVFLLAAAQIVTTHSVTTHWEDIPVLRKTFPGLHVLENQRWVQDGNIITSAGISAGIDMSLYLLSRLTSQEFARKTAHQMEYDFPEENPKAGN